MNTAIIISPDPAGQNIKQFLEELKVPFQEVNTRSIFSEHLDRCIDADIFIFATTHRSAAGVQSLTVHMPGNWNTADLGGNPRELCVAPASLMKDLFLELKKAYPEGEVTLEADHHGPSLQKAACFIEIGSSEEEWKNLRFGKIIAETLARVVGKEKKYRSCIAFGGGHYPSELNKILERTEYAISHICPKYQLEFLDEDLLRQAIAKSLDRVEFALLDWKGLGPHKKKVLTLLEEVGLPYKRIQDLQ